MEKDGKKWRETMRVAFEWQMQFGKDQICMEMLHFISEKVFLAP